MDVQQETAVLTLKAIKAGVRRRTYVRVASVCGNAKIERIGKCSIPRNGSPWVIPRGRNQLNAASLYSRDLPTLEDYGLTIRTGTVVWNRDKRPRFSSRGKITQAKRQRFPLVWSDCIGTDGTFDFERAKQRAPGEIFVGTTSSDPELLWSSAIAVKRTSNSKQSRRIYCAFIDSTFVQCYRAYLGENHVNLLVPKNGENNVDMEILARVLNSGPVDEAFRCLSGSSAVSKYELKKLPLPDLEYVKKCMEDGLEFNEAVRSGLYDA